MARQVLVVDDEREIRAVLRAYLEADGHLVTEAATGAEALRRALATDGSAPDLVLLDVGLPDLDGLEVLRLLRRDSDVYVVLVTARAEEADTLVGLATGADDYVTKPFQVDELLARLRALARRRGGAPAESSVSFGDVEVDLASKAVLRDGARVHLTPTEWQILEHLARHPGALVTRQELLREIWGTEQVADTGYLRLYLSQLRKKLERTPSAPEHLLTEQGMGYRLVLDPA